MTKLLIGTLGFLLLCGLAFSIVHTTKSVPATNAVEGFHYEVVTDPKAQEKGLSGRTELPPGYGMLFVFGAPISPGFWMKDMLMPIDIIWLSEEGRILGIEDSVTPDTYPKAFFPPSPVLYVLETRAGEARARGWSEGTKLPLPLGSQKQ